MKKTGVLLCCTAAVLLVSSCCFFNQKTVTSLSVPQGVTVTLSGKNSGVLSWKSVTDAKMYKIFYALGAEGDEADGEDSSDFYFADKSSSLTVTLDDLEFDGEYSFYVIACYGSIESESSAVVTLAVPSDPDQIIDDKPQDVRASFTPSGQICNIVTFKPINNPAAAEYRIYRSYLDTDGFATLPFVVVQTIPQPTAESGSEPNSLPVLSFDDTDMESNTVYVYYVQSFTADGKYSAASDYVFCRTRMSANVTAESAFNLSADGQDFPIVFHFSSSADPLWFSFTAAEDSYSILLNSVAADDAAAAADERTGGPLCNVYTRDSSRNLVCVSSALSITSGTSFLFTELTAGTEYLIEMYCGISTASSFSLGE